MIEYVYATAIHSSSYYENRIDGETRFVRALRKT